MRSIVVLRRATGLKVGHQRLLLWVPNKISPCHLKFLLAPRENYFDARLCSFRDADVLFHSPTPAGTLIHAFAKKVHAAYVVLARQALGLGAPLSRWTPDRDLIVSVRFLIHTPECAQVVIVITVKPRFYVSLKTVISFR
jgi:hypothetical protein